MVILSSVYVWNPELYPPIVFVMISCISLSSHFIASGCGRGAVRIADRASLFFLRSVLVRLRPSGRINPVVAAFTTILPVFFFCVYRASLVLCMFMRFSPPHFVMKWLLLESVEDNIKAFLLAESHSFGAWWKFPVKECFNDLNEKKIFDFSLVCRKNESDFSSLLLDLWFFFFLDC